MWTKAACSTGTASPLDNGATSGRPLFAQCPVVVCLARGTATTLTAWTCRRCAGANVHRRRAWKTATCPPTTRQPVESDAAEGQAKEIKPWLGYRGTGGSGHVWCRCASGAAFWRSALRSRGKAAPGGSSRATAKKLGPCLVCQVPDFPDVETRRGGREWLLGWMCSGVCGVALRGHSGCRR